MGVILLTQEDVKDLLTMKDVIQACEKTFSEWAEGRVVCPAKIKLDLGSTGVEWPPYKNGMNAMPAYIDWQKSAGIKCVTGSLNNPKWGIPYIIALISLFDPVTGIFRAVMDGALITNYRTGAQAAIAAKHLSNGKRISLGIIGAGAQGRTQLLSFKEVFDLSDIEVFDIIPEAAKKYVEEMKGEVSCPINIANSLEDLVRKVDVVVSVTHGKGKFIKKEWIHPGQIILPLGSFTECDDELLLSADKVIVDHVEQTLHRGALKSVVEKGKFAENDIYATIGEVVSGKKGRDSKEEVIVCVAIGTGAMDVTCATVVYEKAQAQGRGLPFSFDSL